MFKQLLTIAAAVAISFSASAAVLWESQSMFGQLVDWGQPCVALTPDQVAAFIAPGDFIEVTTEGVDRENDWPQVALFGQYGGWPPLASEGVGGKTYPLVSSFPVTNELYASISADGLSVSGNGAYVGKVEVVSSGVEVGPNTVWFGDKKCGWGNGVSLPASLFQDVTAFDQLVFYVDGVGFQVLLGGWNGLNVPCYEFPANVTYQDGKATYTLTKAYAEDGVLEQIKQNGVIMHGDVTVTRIDYIQTDKIDEAVGHATTMEGWEDEANIAPAEDLNIDILKDSKIRINAWAGVEGYDMIVAYDDNFNITGLTPVYNGVEDQTYTSDWGFVNTGNGDEYFAAYLGEGYDVAGAEDGEGLVWLQGYLNGEDFLYYYVEWPLTAEELADAITAAYDEDVAQIQEWTEALADLQDTFPGFGATEEGGNLLSEIAQGIQEYNDAVAAAIEAAAESWGYTSPLTGAIITEMNEKIIGAVAAREELIVAITNAYEEDEALVNELSTAYQEYVDGLDETFPGYAVAKADDFAAMTATITALNDKMTAAMEAANETGVYEGLTGAEITAANEQFHGLMAGEVELANEIEAAYNDDIADINDLATAFQEFGDGLAETFPGYAVVKADDFAAMTATIEALNNQVTEALETAHATGVYDGLSGTEVVDANEQLIALMTGADELIAELQAAYEEDEALFDEIANAVQEYNTQVMDTFPGYTVANAEGFAAMTATVEALYENLTGALMAAFETGVYNGLTGEELTAAAEQLHGLVAGETELLNAIQEEYDADVESINQLATAYQQFVSDTEENFPGYATLHADEIAQLYQVIEGMNTQVSEAMAAAYESGVYNGLTGVQVTEANEQLIGLIVGVDKAMLAIQEEYEADIESVNALAVAYQGLVDEIDENFPGYGVLKADALAALSQKIHEMNDKVVAALAASFETGEYNGLTGAEVTEANEELIGLVAGMEEVANAINEEYEADIENVNELLSAIQGVQNDDEFPAFAEANEEAISEAIADVTALYNKVEAALVDAFATAQYNGPTAEEFMNATEKVMALVTAQAEQFAAIDNAAQADNDILAAYADELDELLAGEEVSEGALEIAAIIVDQLKELQEAVEAAGYEALNETGVYVSPITQANIKLLDRLMNALKTTGINGIEADAEGALYFDINGHQIQKPAAGQMVIKVKNGVVSKVLVK